MKDISCNICDKREKCTKLCPSMIEHLQTISGKKLSYLDMTSYNSDKNIDDVEDLSLYTYGLSKVQERDVKRIIIAILPKDHIEVLKLYSNGYTQKEIGEKLNVSQSSISQKLEHIKKSLKDSIVAVLSYLV
ncbi:RNA polymerase [Brachyspira pilosicoli]|uniref:Putative RNA polymerase domain-containing protein n=2 Tax=Brachyspira pilosicoli TaxID=52584 RepID=A0A3B6VJU3_BRAPL|nr:sigma factor-like helix-turn-helix DNA-binding protein [Brachyspira pilosicoli]AFR71280.1 putative RNA polymerase domain-containing protein [Brachyspira pilosicoli B2904]AGA66058.1 putative RNA polymerase domain-containing protein [Brachyspira pilosicoli P43/6/78]MBW5398567.1 RNA polymerase [Brachyspira pilosicoli]